MLDDIVNLIKRLTECGLAPAFVIMGKMSYSKLREEGLRDVPITELKLPANIKEAMAEYEKHSPIIVFDCPIVVDPTFEHYVRVVPAPYKAALM